MVSTVAGKASGIDQSMKLSQDKRERQAGTRNVPALSEDLKANRPLRRSAGSRPAEIKISLLKPAWIHNELILVRRVRINEDEYLQGCWLDWPGLQSWLIAGIRDILPHARLEAGIDGSDQARSLAALPLIIRPGQLAVSLPPLVSPLRFFTLGSMVLRSSGYLGHRNSVLGHAGTQRATRRLRFRGHS